jgi:hypothetical protein
MTPRESTGYCFRYVVDRALSKRFFSLRFEEEDTIIDIKRVVQKDALWNLHSLVSRRRLLSDCERVRDLFKRVYDSVQPANEIEKRKPAGQTRPSTKLSENELSRAKTNAGRILRQYR